MPFVTVTEVIRSETWTPVGPESRSEQQLDPYHRFTGRSVALPLAMASVLIACVGCGTQPSPAPPSPADTTPPTAPAGLAATVRGPFGISLSWQPSTDDGGVTGYRIERCQGAGCSAFTQIAAPTSTNFTDTGLQPATSYSYQVRAADAAVNLSAYSDVASATTTAPTPPPPPEPSVKFFCSFPSSTSDCGFGEQAKAPGRASIVDLRTLLTAVGSLVPGLNLGLVDVGRDGTPAVRLHTIPGDNNVAGSLDAERDDLTLSQGATDCFEGREQWWAHSILFPDDYVDPPASTATRWNWATVFDFHNSNLGGGQANFQINAWPATALTSGWPTGLAFQIAYGTQTSPTVKNFPIGPVVRNVWYDFVYHVKWSSSPDGYFTAWVNGAKKMDYSGPTIYEGQGCYLKLANYHTPFGQASSVIHDRVIRGATPDAVSLTPLEGIPPVQPVAGM
jgi:hypothetical protein